ncbi:pentapeptide repeat-containing protein [Paenibacillus sp. NPDC058071]|uniref:pentapeptide repeat-containing protein n=1 Tax=Paenibacillus sp. NPDC058071 TaxID=3346326 RepID=UPI0036DE39A5
MAKPKEKLDSPKLPASLGKVTAAYIEDELSVSDCLIQDADWSGQEADRVCFERMRFVNVNLRGSVLNRAEFIDIIFENCDLANLRLNQSVFHRVVFKDCKLLGIDLTDCTLRNTAFIDCYAEYAVFRFANAKRVKLEGGSFAKADFFQFKMTEMYFDETKLDQAQFSQTKLDGVDLSNCEFDSLGATLDDLRGCIISPLQAAAFAGLFGLVVKRDS